MQDYSRVFTNIKSFSVQNIPGEGNIFIISTLQIKKLRHKEVKSHALSHWELARDVNPDCLSPEPMLQPCVP